MLKSLNWRSWLDAAAAVSVIVASASVIWLVVSIRSSGPSQPQSTVQRSTIAGVPANPVPIAGIPIKGRLGVRVGVIKYSEFECPYCGTFARDTLPRVVAEYIDTGRVFLGFRHFPLQAIHPSAVRAAEAAECARRQGKFWEVHDALFSTPQKLSADSFNALREIKGMDAQSFDRCLEAEVSGVIQRDVSDARALGITGTPTFLFGVLNESGGLQVLRRESGALPFDAFAAILDDTIAKSERFRLSTR